MPWIELLGNDIYYREAGSGQPVVLVHGKGSCADCWEPIMDALTDQFHVLAYDSVDHGRSANSPRDEPAPDRADELEAFLAALRIARPVIIGQSMGSMTTLRWAVRHPSQARALVMCGMGWPISVSKLPPTLDEDEGIWLGVGDSFTSEWIDQHPREYERYVRVRSTATAIEADRHPRAFTAVAPSYGADDPQMVTGIPAIASPLLLFVGEREEPSILAGARNVHALVPSSQFEIVPAAAHNAYYQAKDQLVERVLSFLEKTNAAVAS